MPIEIHPGKYVHFSLEKCLKIAFDSAGIVVPPKNVRVCISIDGIPLVKSKGSQFWPILGFMLSRFHA